MNTSPCYATRFDPVFRSWLVSGPDDTPRLIIKTGFLCQVGNEEWPLSLHNFIVYDGAHTLLGTLEPRLPLPSGRRRFTFHRHGRNDFLDLPGGFASMDEVIDTLLLSLIHI